MRKNPLLYSEASELEQSPPPVATAPAQKDSSSKSSFFFYIIILANSLLVLFVLGFIWFLFLKSPDLHIKEISDRFFGTSTPTIQEPQPIVAPEIQTEVLLTPSQQEKDEIQQAKLKQMREREELAAERVRLEEIKAEIEQEKLRAKEAQQAIESLKEQKDKAAVANPSTTNNSSAPNKVIEPLAMEVAEEKPVEIEQTRVEDLTPRSTQQAESVNSQAAKPATASPVIKEPSTKSPPSQFDRIMEELQQQQKRN